VVIKQQNVGSVNQVGGGELKYTDEHKSPGEVEAEQEPRDAEPHAEQTDALNRADIANGESNIDT
jgi:hypothetical protein